MGFLCVKFLAFAQRVPRSFKLFLGAWRGDTRESQHRGDVKKYFLFVLKRKI